MRIYNTLTRKVEEFIPWDSKEVKFYNKLNEIIERSGF